MEIRPAIVADISAIAGIEQSAGALFRGTHMDWAVGETTDQCILSHAVAECNFWVAEVKGQLVGFLLAGTCGAAFHISEVAVHQDYRRQRIGAALVEAALVEAQRRGHRQATLTTDQALAWNARYYERLGFSVLAPDETPAELAVILAGERNPHLRCAMTQAL